MTSLPLHCLHAGQLLNQTRLSCCLALCCGAEASFHRLLMDVFFCLFMGMCVFFFFEREESMREGETQRDGELCERESGSPEMKR